MFIAHSHRLREFADHEKILRKRNFSSIKKRKTRADVAQRLFVRSVWHFMLSAPLALLASRERIIGLRAADEEMKAKR